MRIVLLTHVFPRAAQDSLGAFLLHLTRQLANANEKNAESNDLEKQERVDASPIQGFGERVNVSVVAPHAAGLLESETLEKIPVTRFRYASDAHETLAYTGIMHEHVARGMGGKILFARFLSAYFFAARCAVRTHKANVIHAHWWLPGGFVGALVSKLTRVPLIITTHGTDVEQLRRAGWTIPLARFTFSQARVITCGSNYLRAQLLELGVADETRVRVIPMPVNPMFEKREARREKREGAFKILTVARLTKQKSIEVLIAALEILRGRGIEARLNIVGEGDQRAVLQEQTRAKHLETFVEFLGARPQSDLPNLYANCDVFVLPSVREGMGLVLVEALLCGAPVIATNSGGVTDIVRDGETGLLFPERDANALAVALEKYARDSQYAARLAENGRAFVLQAFSPERVAEKFLNEYARAIH